VLSAVPTALSGLADWSDTSGRTRRVGIAHALLNSAGLVAFTLSWRARRRGHHGRGLLFTVAGSAAVNVAASLGGHLVYRTGTGVDVNAFEHGPKGWTPLDGSLEPVSDLDGGYATAAGEPLLVSWAAPEWHAIGARCSHRGGPLQEGTVANGCVTCPWHQSRFRLDDGAIVDGPAAAPQPNYSVREVDGQLEVASDRDVSFDLPESLIGADHHAIAAAGDSSTSS
jgi:nitrite reductase/ring-hydroxylating ferredoxin subunit